MNKPVLFSPNAGFPHARVDAEHRTPITVERSQKVIEGMRYWNALAGWRLFTFADDPEISIHAKDSQGNELACWIIDPRDNWAGPYIRVGIALQTNSKSDGAHELGHALGMRHNQPRGAMSQGKVRPRFDRKLLIEAGYRGGT